MSYAAKAAGSRKGNAGKDPYVTSLPAPRPRPLATPQPPLPPRARSGRGPVLPRPAAREAPEVDWDHVAIFAGGIALGLALGAGAALLLAPQSGAEARHAIVRRGRKLGVRTHNAWDDLRDELEWATVRAGRNLRGAIRRRRRAPADEPSGI
jgi:hypothetical protein